MGEVMEGGGVPVQAQAFDLPGMRPLPWSQAFSASQAIVQFIRPEAEQLEALRTRFGLHDLQVKDILNPQHPARLFKMTRGNILILRLPRLIDTRLQMVSVSLLFDGKLCVIVWPDAEEVPLDRRLLAGVDLNDAVCRALHALVDRLFRNLNPLLESADELEDACFENIEKADMAALLGVRQHLVVLARAARGNFAALDQLIGGGLFTGNHHLSDAHEHMQRCVSRGESAAEHLLAVMQAIQSLLGQRMNETIKVLTIITVVLSPLAVITGIFGMNFQHMPILEWSWGFAVSLIAMALIAGVLAAIFKWKRWW